MLLVQQVQRVLFGDVVKVAQRKRQELAVDDGLYGNTTKSLPESFNSLTVGVGGIMPSLWIGLQLRAEAIFQS